MTTTSVRTPNGLRLTHHRLQAGDDLRVSAATHQEVALILISGQLTATVDGERQVIDRLDPFTAPAAGWFLPPGAALTVAGGRSAADVGVISSPAPATLEPARITPITVPEPEVRGRGSWERHVTTLLQPPQTSGVLLGETIAHDGRWSTYPPHRHQLSDPPQETALEEAFLFRVRPDTGFGIFLTYDGSVRDAHTEIVTDGTLAAVPKGYHTVAVAGGHDIYYLWAAHGSTDSHFALRTDPAHEWLLDR
ncbi:5-deoxy-glucuronate isomerase [Kitasatospora sp. MAP5-34]|uniref:5-deoxy-glucuronate isomerase n=1 Tax=Kitasatospora sp. MAP5-34 TaxID=3035102 RepID=UPI002474CA8E|nr:5-deoxy-glucuronate isomerase [Kitasatospora sp. MAP5-34]MDH6578638.1 5-deoxy-glucuronate isomerase [Kitasatospora sp. MAP5-34]